MSDSQDMADQDLFLKIQNLLDDHYGDLPVNSTTDAVVLSETVAQHIMNLLAEQRDQTDANI